MTVNELKNLLEQMADAGHGEREVLFVYQQNYPLQDEIKGGWIPEGTDDEEDARDGVVYLVSNGQCYDAPYGPRQAFAEATETL